MRVGLAVAEEREQIGPVVAPMVEIVPPPAQLQVRSCRVLGAVGKGLEDVSLTVRRGELLGVFGARQQGWGSLLQAMLGNVPWQDGQLWLDGEPVAPSQTRFQQQLGASLHAGPWHSRQSVMQALQHVAAARGIARSEGQARIVELLRFFEQPSLAQVGLCQLRASERRWISVIQALLHRPNLLLLEQPTLGMDASEQQRFWQLMGILWQHHAMGVVVFSEQGQELDHCEQIVLLHHGRIVEQGQREQLLGVLEQDHVMMHTIYPEQLLAWLGQSLQVQGTSCAGGVLLQHPDGKWLMSQILLHAPNSLLQGVALQPPSLPAVLHHYTGFWL